MYKGFKNSDFLKYIKKNFEDVGDFTIALIENVLNYAHKWEHTSKDQFIWFLLDLFPALEFGEIAQFADDKMLTVWGIKEKNAYIKSNQ